MPPARPPRRTLHRQARVLPQHLAQSRLLAELQRQRLPADFDPPAMQSLFASVWRHGQDAVWSIAELRQQRLLPPDTNGQRLGQVLAELAAKAAPVGAWRVHRVDTGSRKLAEGRLWQLQRW
jgi:hypothetical protein